MNNECHAHVYAGIPNEPVTLTPEPNALASVRFVHEPA